MRRTHLTGALVLAVSGMLITGAVTPAGAADDPRPKPEKASKAEARQDAHASLGKQPKAALAGTHDAFKARSTKVDKDGTRHVHFDRTYKDLPVLGGDVIVHSAPDGALRETTLSLEKPIAVGTDAEVSAAAAEKTARKLFSGKREGTSSELVVDAATGERPRLAWSPSHFNVLIDATTGKAGQSWNDFHTAEGTGDGYHVGDVSLSTTPAGGDYRLMDPERGNGETRDAENRTSSVGSIPDSFGASFTDSDNAWGDGTLGDRATVAVDAHYGIQETWDYYQDVHGRSGIRDDGVGAQSFVH